MYVAIIDLQVASTLSSSLDFIPVISDENVDDGDGAVDRVRAAVSVNIVVLCVSTVVAESGDGVVESDGNVVVSGATVEIGAIVVSSVAVVDPS